MQVRQQADARKEPLGPEAALELARQVNEIWVAKGKKVVHFNMKKDPPGDEELLKHLLGPSGNLRAPAIRRGKRLFVGFSEELGQQMVK